MPTEIKNQIDRIGDAVGDIKTAIRNKGVEVPTTAKIGDLAPLVSSIRTASPNLVDTSSGDAVAGEILKSKKAWVDGVEVTGTMENRGAVTETLGMNSVGFFKEYASIPAGYHNGNGRILINPEEKTVTPTKEPQTINPSSGKVLKKVTVNPIPDKYQDVSGVSLAPDDVLVGEKYIDSDGVLREGTMPNNEVDDVVLDTTTTSYRLPFGYNDGTALVSINLEQKTVTPTESSQTVTPTDGKVLSSVTVNSIPSNYKDATGANASPSQVVAGTKFVGANGVVEEGTLYNLVHLDTLVIAPMTNAEINANLVSGAFVKAANNYVTMSDLSNGATVNGSVIPSSNFYELFEGVISTNNMQFISVLPVAVGKDLDGVVFNESGTYVLAQACQSGIEITIPNFKFIKTPEVVERGTTTITSRRNTSNNTIVLTAENNQGAGYVAGGKSTATKTVSLSVSGKTVTATDGTNSISASVSDSYIIPSGTKSITSAGTHDVTAFASATVAEGSCTVSGGGLTAGNGSVSATGTNVTLTETTSPSGYYITTTGSGSVSRADIKDTHVAGYIPAKSATTVISGASASSNTATKYYTVATEEKTVTSSTSAQTVTPTSGKLLSKVTVNAIGTTTQATPSITVSSAGLITASATQTAGYVSAGTKSATKQLTTQGAKTVTPTTSNQTAVASGRYTTGTITVEGDSNLVAGNIKKGVSIFGVTGTYEGGANVATCNVTITIVDNVGYVGVTATTFASGAIGTFTQGKSSGTFTISNVVCGSIISVICNGMFSIDASINVGSVGATSQYLIAPKTAGNYTAQIIAYDD